MTTIKHIIKRYKGGVYSEHEDEILKELTLSVYLECDAIVKLVCLPADMEELVYGYLYSEGIISRADDVKSIEFVGCDARVWLSSSLSSGLEGGVGGFVGAETDMVTTDSGDYIKAPRSVERAPLGAVFEPMDWKPEVVLRNANLMLEKSEVFTRTGNVHSAMICRDADVLYFYEDIGRYNAFDKCVGRALLDKADISRSCLYTSGRLPGSVALKAVRAGIPMIVSRSAPTDATIEIAAQYGMTIIGFAKGDRFNLYS